MELTSEPRTGIDMRLKRGQRDRSLGQNTERQKLVVYSLTRKYKTWLNY